MSAKTKSPRRVERGRQVTRWLWRRFGYDARDLFWMAVLGWAFLACAIQPRCAHAAEPVPTVTDDFWYHAPAQAARMISRRPNGKRASRGSIKLRLRGKRGRHDETALAMDSLAHRLRDAMAMADAVAR